MHKCVYKFHLVNYLDLLWGYLDIEEWGKLNFDPHTFLCYNAVRVTTHLYDD